MNYTDEQLETEVRATIKAQGCMCKVDVVLDRPDPDLPNFVHVEARHDNWCPLALARHRRNS